MIKKFDKYVFEAALPKDKTTGLPLWLSKGLVDGEYSYSMGAPQGLLIQIRSSVRSNGLAAETGKDSIRVWLSDRLGNPTGSKVQSYITRVPGWEERLTSILRVLWKRAAMLKTCPECKHLMDIFKVKKEGRNKGRLFTKCLKHDHFKWLEGEPEAILPVGASNVAELVINSHFKKDAVQALKLKIKSEPSWMLYALRHVFSKQTSDERATDSARWKNKVGFSAFDAEILSSCARQYEQKKFLSEKQIALCLKRVSVYAGQIVKDYQFSWI
jgi:hypothetical protein